MCGRYVLSGDPFHLGAKDNFNVSPGQDMPVKTVKPCKTRWRTLTLGI
mgnify:CR=1 FL=1